jgi:hypothetical protein
MSVHVGRRDPFSGFRVKVWCVGWRSRVVAVMPCLVRSPRQPYLGTADKLCRSGVRFSRTTFSYIIYGYWPGIFGSSSKNKNMIKMVICLPTPVES